MTLQKRHLTFFDTTLRDGAQTPGVEFSAQEKRIIAEALAQTGINYIEGGFPAEGNRTDLAFFDRPGDLGQSRLVAFGMTMRKGIGDNDPHFASVINAANAQTTCLVAKSWDKHVTAALGIKNPRDYLDVIRRSTAAAAGKKETHIDLEHFFDGFHHNPAFAMAALRAAAESGAGWITLCDTNGGSTPTRIRKTVETLLRDNTDLAGRLGIHCHNDRGLATANTLAAIEAGCDLVQGTINGLGERCGNANLLEVIPTVMSDPDYQELFECTIDQHTLAVRFPALRRLVYRLSNLRPRPDDPYYGEDAFATKAGIHASAVIKGGADLYEHSKPALFGQQTRIRMSRQGGLSNLCAVLDQMGVDHAGKKTQMQKLYSRIMEKEELGFSYVYAEASLELLAREILGEATPVFDIHSARSGTQIRYNARGERIAPSESVLTIAFNGQESSHVAESDHGPVDAMAQALKKCLKEVMPAGFVNGVTLVDYDLHNMGEGTDSKVRVQISFAGEVNGKTQQWTTVGVSENSTMAALQALRDCYRWHIMKTGGWQADMHPAATAGQEKQPATLKNG